MTKIWSILVKGKGKNENTITQTYRKLDMCAFTFDGELFAILQVINSYTEKKKCVESWNDDTEI